jgi:phosphohistidine phosphatase
MKTLYLLRHAKSSWDDPDLKDFERPLNERGINDIPNMVSRFQSRQSGLDSIVCSPAIRAKSTAHLWAKNVEFPLDDIISNPELYFAGTNMFLKAASLLDDDCESAMLIGHNPAITEFVNQMGGSDIENIPTCGLVELELQIDDWSDIKLGDAKVVEFDFPKKGL